MTIQLDAWEQRLLAQAYAPLEGQWRAHTDPQSANRAGHESAYRHCETITRQHSRTFYLAARLLPTDQRRAMHALYAFCRVSDDLVEADVAAGVVDDRWRAFMRFQIARARRLFAEALPGVAMLGQSGRFAIGAAAELYQAILDDIEANDYDVFTRRAHTSERQKLALLPGIWWRARFGNYPGRQIN